MRYLPNWLKAENWAEIFTGSWEKSSVIGKSPVPPAQTLPQICSRPSKTPSDLGYWIPETLGGWRYGLAAQRARLWSSAVKGISQFTSPEPPRESNGVASPCFFLGASWSHFYCTNFYTLRILRFLCRLSLGSSCRGEERLRDELKQGLRKRLTEPLYCEERPRSLVPIVNLLLKYPELSGRDHKYPKFNISYITLLCSLSTRQAPKPSKVNVSTSVSNTSLI